jgi:hypothetical protein
MPFFRHFIPFFRPFYTLLDMNTKTHNSHHSAFQPHPPKLLTENKHTRNYTPDNKNTRLFLHPIKTVYETPVTSGHKKIKKL